MQDNNAFQVTVAAVLIPLPAGTDTVFFQNLGPNDVWLGSSAATATAAAGIKVPGNGGEIAIDVHGHALYAACPAGLQVSPNDLRWYARG